MLITVKSTLSATITAEVIHLFPHLPDESPCGCITDHGRESALHRFGANLHGVTQQHIQSRNAFVEKV